MRNVLLGLMIVVVAVVFSGCDDLLADPPKPKEKITIETVVADELIIIRNRQHTLNVLCKDGLEYLIVSQVKALAITPHWVVENGTQQIKTCN